MNSTYFRKGFGLKGEIEEQLAADYHSGLVDLLRARDYPLAVGPAHLPAGPGIRLLLRRRPRGGLRLRDPAQVSRPAALPGGRDHPQPAREPEAASRWASSSCTTGADGEFDFSAVTPDDVVILPAFGVTIDDFERLRAHRLRAGGHDLRLGAQRVEAGRELRARRLTPRSSTASTTTRRPRPRRAR